MRAHAREASRETTQLELLLSSFAFPFAVRLRLTFILRRERTRELQCTAQSSQIENTDHGPSVYIVCVAYTDSPCGFFIQVDHFKLEECTCPRWFIFCDESRRIDLVRLMRVERRRRHRFWHTQQQNSRMQQDPVMAPFFKARCSHTEQ